MEYETYRPIYTFFNEYLLVRTSHDPKTGSSRKETDFERKSETHSFKFVFYCSAYRIADFFSPTPVAVQ